MITELDERDEATLRFMAMADEMTYAAARRSALSERCAQIRAEMPWVADAVEAAIAYRRRRDNIRYFPPMSVVADRRRQ